MALELGTRACAGSDSWPVIVPSGKLPRAKASSGSATPACTGLRKAASGGVRSRVWGWGFVSSEFITREPFGNTSLLGGQPKTGAGVHGFENVLDQFLQGRIELRHRLCFVPQAGIGMVQDLQNGHVF